MGLCIKIIPQFPILPPLKFTIKVNINNQIADLTFRQFLLLDLEEIMKENHKICLQATFLKLQKLV